MLRELHLDPEGLSEVELYDIAWHLVVKSIPDTPEGQKSLTAIIEHFDLDETEKKEASLNRDLAVLGIGNIENLRAMARAQGKKLVLPGDIKKPVVE